MKIYFMWQPVSCLCLVSNIQHEVRDSLKTIVAGAQKSSRRSATLQFLLRIYLSNNWY